MKPLYPCRYDETMTIEEMMLWLFRHIKLKQVPRNQVLPFKLEIRKRNSVLTEQELKDRWRSIEDLYFKTYGEVFD